MSVCIIKHNQNTVRFTKFAQKKQTKDKQQFELWTQNIYKDWFHETLCKIDEQ